MLHLLAVLITCGMFGAGFGVGKLFFRRLLRLHRRRTVSRSRPEHWAAIVTRNLPITRNLTPGELQRLLEIAQDLVDTRAWEGCGGLALTEEMQVSIAAQAGILVLGLPTPAYSQIDAILVYPSTFQPRRFSWTPSREPEERVATLGEAWRHGVVILSWDAVRGGAVNPFDGKNVVFHEFAHQLDAEDGSFDGVPVLGHRSAYTPWATVVEREYDDLCRAEEKGRRSVLRHYGATNRAEFFAVASEAFFEKSLVLKRKKPELYQELVGFYRQDPASWPSRTADMPIDGSG